MIDAPLALAFAAGMVAAFNPCGFALLPAYLSYFLRPDAPAVADGRALAGLGRALVVGAVVTAGFAVVFGAVGILVTQLSLSVQRFAPWLSLVIGAGMAVLGVAVLLGYHPDPPVPRFVRGGRGRGLPSMALFGISYAVVSLSCTLPVFLAAVGSTFDRSTFAAGVSVFGAYALGMGSVLMALAFGMVLARQAVLAHARRVLPFVHRLAGLVLAAAGGYVAWYAWYALQLDRGRTPGAGPVDRVSRWSGDVSAWVERTGASRIALAVAAGAGVSLAVVWRATRLGERSRRKSPSALGAARAAPARSRCTARGDDMGNRSRYAAAAAVTAAVVSQQRRRARLRRAAEGVREAILPTHVLDLPTERDTGDDDAHARGHRHRAPARPAGSAGRRAAWARRGPRGGGHRLSDR